MYDTNIIISNKIKEILQLCTSCQHIHNKNEFIHHKKRNEITKKYLEEYAHIHKKKMHFSVILYNMMMMMVKIK